MKTPTLSIIGAGRAGGSLARSWHSRGGFDVIGLHSRSDKSQLAKTLTAKEVKELTKLPASDAVMIATSDNAIASVAQQLASSCDIDWPGKIVFHLSGALPAVELQPLADKGAMIASAHPVRAFSHDQTELEGTLVGLEGQPQALPFLKAAFHTIGATCFSIESAKKTSYHAAAVIASNHLIALADASQQLWQQAGIDRATAKVLFESLTSGVVQNLRDKDPSTALTGPIARGDAETVATHTRVLVAQSPQIAALYGGLSRYLIESIELGHSDVLTKELLAALAKNAD